MINISNISKSFDDRVILQDISFSIKNGDKIAIIGQSGIGKSVLLKSIIGLLNPDEGEIFINEQDIASKIRKAVSDVVFEGKIQTYDMAKMSGHSNVVDNGAASTTEMANCIISKL